jgi:hypothetical protein
VAIDVLSVSAAPSLPVRFAHRVGSLHQGPRQPEPEIPGPPSEAPTEVPLEVPPAGPEAPPETLPEVPAVPPEAPPSPEPEWP